MKYSSFLIIFSTILFQSIGIAQQNASTYYEKSDSYQKKPLAERNLEAQRLYDQGLKHYENGAVTESIQYFDEAITIKPNFIDAYFARAAAKDRMNDYQGALIDYEIVIHLEPELTEAYFKRALLKYHNERFQEAIDDLNQLLVMPSRSTNAVFYKGVSYGEGKKTPAFSEIISMYSKEADIYNYRGLAFMKLNEYQQAIEDFNKAIEINHTDANFYVNRGMAKLKNNDRIAAKEDFKHALDIDPWNQAALYNLTAGLADNQKKEVLISSYTKAINRDKDLVEAYVNRAVINFELGNYSSALKDLDSAVNLNPEDPQVYLNRGLTYLKLHDFNNALDDFLKAKDLYPGNRDVNRYIGNAYFHLKDYDKAIDYYNLILGGAANDQNALFNRGMAKLRLGKTDEACKDIRRAQDLGLKQASKVLKKYCY